MFLGLHSYFSDEKMIYISIDKISDFTDYVPGEEFTGTLVTMENGNKWAVQETPQQIADLINKAGRINV